ncbi:TetR/AcrR family transcriptional regulator, acrAB operon repressor [Amycolatopsis sacchari]|uniref:TetR/AcrR family transcriptional regulator, acrAB operon repressor n=1 Tax=Amycolatopsis sacchari TaxID=115433 RepID=A0A1I3RCQ7_9PSEU|nr:TetR/AcrR family transcriptional regulator [Amycolatopsis sacchari]SFJ43820.1 TetR/AcrR family transcriptional regulator, acrAB operon repressor [Amycolatopsis sacchari]
MSGGSGVAEHGRRRIDEIGEESRRRILDAAEELFADRGFERTSFVDIAKRSGISRGSIPWHFRNKDGLLMAVLARAMDRFLPPERYQRSLPSLATLLLDYESWARSGNSALIFMVLTEAMGSTGAVRGQYQEFFETRRRRVVRWLRAQRPAGAGGGADDRERAAAVALNGAVMGIHLQFLVDPEVDLEAALQSLAALVDTNLAVVWGGTRDP